MLGFGIIVPLLPFYAKSMHASPGEIALIFSAYSMGGFFGEPFWGRGIATAALAAAAGYAFRELGMIRVFAVPFATNLASARVLEKAGFVREAVLRSSAIKEGIVLDQWLYAITKPGRPSSNRAMKA